MGEKRKHFVTCGQMKLLEKRADESGLSYNQMMENAGTRAAEVILERMAYRKAVQEDGQEKGEGKLLGKQVAEKIGGFVDGNTKRPVVISRKSPNNDLTAFLFCGKGNNGGDGFVVGRILRKNGYRVVVILVDGEPKTEDAIKNYRLLQKLPVTFLDLQKNERGLMDLKGRPDLMVDAVYGTGFHGQLEGNGLKMAIYLNKDAGKEDRPLVVALDIPSGLSGDLTSVKRLEPASVKADCTITFHARKPVHLQGFAAEYCGEIIVADIGINEEKLWNVMNR